EAPRADQTFLGMLPAQQGFGSENTLLVSVDLRLIVQAEGALLQRATQVVLHSQAAADVQLHLRLEEGDAVAPAGLDPIQRGVGVLEQILRGAAVLTGQGNTYAATKLQGVAFHPHGGGECVQQGQAWFLTCSVICSRLPLRPASTTTNSSPPSRATVSVLRTP